MHPDMEKLNLLQKLDLTAAQLQQELASLPGKIASVEAKLKSSEEHLAATRARIAKEEALRRSQESDIKDHQAKMARVRKQMDMATTTAQVTAFEHEIGFAQAEIGRLEDAELASMERSEQLEEEGRKAAEAVEDTRVVLARERERATQTADHSRTKLEELKSTRVALRQEIDESLLSIYDRIAKAKGTAVAEAVNQKCSACQMLVRPQKWNDLADRTITEIATCESCGRMLYYDPAQDAPQRKPMGVESIAASIVRSR